MIETNAKILIVGIVVVIVAIAGLGAYFMLREGGPGGGTAAMGIPRYPGATEFSVPSELKTLLAIPDSVTCEGYMVDAGVEDVTDWYKNQMDDWTLEREDTTSPPDMPEMIIYIQHYKKDENGAFIFVMSDPYIEEVTILGIVTGPWSLIQGCGTFGGNPPESREADMVAVAEAREDIEEYRKGDVTLTIVDAQGQPRSGVAVDYTQTKHSFLFGFFNYGDENADVLITPMKQVGLNSAIHIMNWYMQEHERGVYNFDGWENNQEVQDFHQAELIGIGYSLSMTSTVPEFTLVPSYAYSLPFDELKEAVYQYIHETVEYYENKIKIWNVFNEPMVMSTNALDLSEQQEIEIIEEGVRAIRDVDPEAQIMINVWPPGGELAYMHPYDFLQDVIDAGVDFDIIGLEWYYNAYGAPYWGGGQFLRRSLASIDEVIDLYSTLGKKLFITEISMPSEDIGQGYWGEPWSEELQAEYLEAAYTIFFSSPQVECISYWDVTDRGAFIYHGGLLDNQNQPKAAYYTLVNLIENWTTTGTGVTDENGQVTFRGFGGTYEVVVSDPETALSMEQEIIIEEQENNVLTLVLG